ncbi:MAG: AAA family ATPase [Eubacteriaceae bacterium]|nr:AAA family ATPase [Eubacteriaceae bacterium]
MFPILFLTGPRQVGKKTVLQQLAQKDRRYVALDTPSDRAFAKSDPELFIQRYAPPVVIDEVQYAPELFDYIKVYVDIHKNNGDFWLTGSQTFHLMKNVTESLEGRAGIVRMLGLSNNEIDATGFGPFQVVPEKLFGRMEHAVRLSFRHWALRVSCTCQFI